jgi:hypothetical protein
MDRVQASEAWGRGFESHAARQINNKRERDDIRPLFFYLGCSNKKGEENLAILIQMSAWPNQSLPHNH